MPQTHESSSPFVRPESGTQVSLMLDSIDDNPYQPRLTYDDQHITELADGIRRDGLLSPIVVRPDPKTPGRYQVLAGHCRLRAFRRLLDRSDIAEERRFERIPALLRTHVTDEEMARLAINENLQRRDLSPTDAALALANYRKMMGLKTARDVARAMDLDENRVKRLLRLHEAPPFIKAAVGEGILIELPGSASGANGASKRKRQTLDLMGALEFARMFRIFYAHEPERAEKRVRAGIDKALREAWAFPASRPSLTSSFEPASRTQAVTAVTRTTRRPSKRQQRSPSSR